MAPTSQACIHPRRLRESYGRDAPAPIELLTFHRQEEQEEIFGGRIRVQIPPAEGLAAVIGGFQGLGGSCPTIGPRRDFLSVDRTERKNETKQREHLSKCMKCLSSHGRRSPLG